MAKYPFIVNKNGVWYPAGAEVPEGAKTLKNNIDDEKVDTEVQYTKTDINRMSTAELKEIAKKHGIKNAENMTGADLKVELIKKLRL